MLESLEVVVVVSRALRVIARDKIPRVADFSRYQNLIILV